MIPDGNTFARDSSVSKFIVETSVGCSIRIFYSVLKTRMLLQMSLFSSVITTPPKLLYVSCGNGTRFELISNLVKVTKVIGRPITERRAVGQLECCEVNL